MARIRTIKPEAFASESLASVSLSAERTFFGLLTQADDHGRFRDQAAVIAGLLWSLRPDHGPLGVEDDLTQLASANLICRYEGSDGKRYLHIVTFDKHQKINRPSGVRYPDCPHHHGGQPAASALAPSAHGTLTYASVRPHGGVREDAPRTREPAVNGETAGQEHFSEPSPQPHGEVRELVVRAQGPDLGPRTLDQGSTPLGGASAPAPEAVSAKHLVTEYVAACAHRPPSSVLARLGQEIAKLLADGIAPSHIRAGLERLRAKGLHTSVLPSLVNEAMNATPSVAASPSRHRPYTNPTDAEAAYGGAL
ncbi:hypothetical protein AMK26_23775 [Streptomyces sp. CB03234]|uniref:hypothetical protein n=1 Tax=Streptomyces sp. (strain CB03234) TaxID=1703937 RepID=UPI00093C5CCB|nr:hypothetical protein [Streptomyces sp. CB03234]OKK02627.1 hypothetical protein AMK26_23775 [Streptomyces sp. CB03234]